MVIRLRAAAIIAGLLIVVPMSARSAMAATDGVSGVVVIEGTLRGHDASDCVDAECLNGPVAKAIEAALGDRSMTIAGFFDRVRRNVLQLTDRRQAPWMSASALVDVPLFGDPSHSKALVIGNGAYSKVPPLKGAPKDAALVGKVLENAGFKVRTLIDVQTSDVKARLGEFFESLDESDVAVVYFSGHGFSTSGGNYLASLASDLADIASMTETSINVATLADAFTKSKADRKLLILDTHFPPLPSAVTRQELPRK